MYLTPKTSNNPFLLANPSLEPTTTDLLVNLRNQLFKDLMVFYEADDNIEDPEVRMGNLILIMSGIKVDLSKLKESIPLNFGLLKIPFFLQI